MKDGRGTLTALHLFLVWAMTAAAVPTLGVGLLAYGWAGGLGAAGKFLALGVPLVLGLLTLAALPMRPVRPLYGSLPRRLGWALLVFALGTLGVVAGVAAYGKGVDLGGAGTRIALTGVPYAVAAAFFVPSRWVRLGALAALAGAVAYGGFIGPAQARQDRQEAEVARYREHAQLLYLGDAPPGLQVSHAVLDPAAFIVDYRPVREGYETGYVGLVVRAPSTETPRCPEPAEKDVTCRVDAHGEMVRIRDFPGGAHEVTLTRRQGSTEAEVTSQTLPEPALRRLLDTLHPLSDGELETLMREKRIDHQN
ncbi:hypothetical protein AB0E88_12310 [Streptomyces sp. NPDC028635]|uniref:hypothetical protein n=1 Tax=Streptomyces sp. NPDC028635 TaxID=3154800 RepID=UPI0033CAEB88